MESKASTFHALLAASCIEKGLTTAALAEATGASHATITRLMTGDRCDIGVVRSVIDVLDISFEQVRNVDHIGDAVAYLWCPEMGEYLQQQRSGKTSQALADTIGVNLSTVKRWERGTVRPTRENITALTTAYMVELSDLLGHGLWPPTRYPGATTIGHVLRARREALGVSQRAFAKMLDTNKDTYRNWEAGISQPDADNRELLAWALDIDVQLLHDAVVRVERESSNRSDFSTMLTRHRKALGLTREALARCNGLTVADIQRFENLKAAPSFWHIEKVTSIYGLSRDQVDAFLPKAKDESFGSWLRATRMAAGKTTYALQEEAGISRNTFVFLESNRARPSVAHQRRLAKALGVELTELQTRLALAGPAETTVFGEACRKARVASGQSLAQINRRHGKAANPQLGLERGLWMPKRENLVALAQILEAPLSVLEKAWVETKNKTS